jgi:hypothetical protein
MRAFPGHAKSTLARTNTCGLRSQHRLVALDFSFADLPRADDHFGLLALIYLLAHR